MLFDDFDCSEKLCGKCKHRLVKPGCKWCEDCLKRAAAQYRKKKQRRMASGNCLECNGPAAEGKRLCAGCAEAKSVYEKERRKRLKVEGLCIICGQCEPRPGKVNCQRCHDDNREWYERNWDKQRAKVRQKSQQFRQMILDAYGAKCACCGETRREFLAIDHVHGGGGKHRKAKSTEGTWKEIVAKGFPPEYRILCHNCNSSLGWYGYCPHKVEREAKDGESTFPGQRPQSNRGRPPTRGNRNTGSQDEEAPA